MQKKTQRWVAEGRGLCYEGVCPTLIRLRGKDFGLEHRDQPHELDVGIGG
jgi:hypothetical protein